MLLGVRMRLEASRPGRRFVAARWLAEEWLWLLAVAVGTVLRLDQLAAQIVADDEWHALYALLRRSYLGIVTHFGEADYSIPLALLYRAVADTVGLSEVAMRLPVVAAGLATLVVLPLLVRDLVGPEASRASAWLLAVSPLHVYFSRYARPYSISLLCAVVALIAFYRWWSGGREAWARVFVIGAVFGAYLHLSVLPAVGAPLLFAALHRAAGRAARPPRGRLLAVAGAAAVALALLLLPPMLVDWPALVGKARGGRVGLDTLEGAARLFGGTRHGALLLASAALAAWGAWRLGRIAPSLARLAWLVVGCQIGFLVLVRPVRLEVPVVLMRYALPLLAVWLLVVGIGTSGVDAVLRRALPRVPSGIVPLAFGVTLLLLGPLPEAYYRPNSWTNHALFQYGYEPAGPDSYNRDVRPQRISSFYLELARLPRQTVVLAEVPWFYEWGNNPFPYYQRIHRQRMIVGFLGHRCDEPPGASRLPIGGPHGLRFEHYFCVSDIRGLRQQRVRYVVFHRDLIREIPGRPVPGYPPYPTPMDVRPWVELYARAFGPPVFEDEDLVVFDLMPRPPPPG
jgi:hypothetical protein